MFGVRATASRSWLANPDNNYLSWSFGMCILADFLFFIAGMCIYVQFLRLRGERDDPDDIEPKVFLTNEPPSTTNYRYTPGRDDHPMRSEPAQANQPAYVQRFQKNQNSRPEPKYPNSTFAVSGSGEVYVNTLADYDRYRDDYRDGYRERGRSGLPPWREQNTEVKKPPNSQLDSSMDGTYTGSDYEKSKNVIHPALPEYSPKSTRKNKQDKTEVVSNSDTKEEKKKIKRNGDSDSKGVRKSHSDSKKKRSGSRDRSRSGSRSRKKKVSDSEYSDTGSTKKRSRHRSRSRDESDDDRCESRRRSRRRRKSRSRSRDRDSSYSDSQVDSDGGSVRSKSKKRREREAKKKHSSHEDLPRGDKKKSSNRKKKNRDGNISDDKSVGSEYSQRRSRRKNDRDSNVDSKKRVRDFSETESVKSNRIHNKPKGTYSSYYE